MKPRASSAYFPKGSVTVDYPEPLSEGEAHYAFFAPWGSVYIRFRESARSLEVFDYLSGPPDLGYVRDWAASVDEALQSAHGVRYPGLIEDIVASIQKGPTQG